MTLLGRSWWASKVTLPGVRGLLGDYSNAWGGQVINMTFSVLGALPGARGLLG